MKALLLDETHPFLERDLERGGLQLVREFSRLPSEFPAEHFDADALIVRSRFPIDAPFLGQFRRLKTIGRLGAGLENIDLDYCERHGIQTHRVPEGNARAVAEHALGMLLSLLNHIPRAQREVREGLWRREENKGTELNSLVVGIIGYGPMGSTFAQLLHAMGIKVLVHDKYLKDYAAAGLEEVSLSSLQQRAQVVSLHLPLTAETRGYANAAFFAAFEHPIHLINTARGPIVDSAALVHALHSGRVRSAGLDTLEYEKGSFTGLADNPRAELPGPLRALLEMEQVIITPHIAGWTAQSFEKMGTGLAAKVLASLGVG